LARFLGYYWDYLLKGEDHHYSKDSEGRCRSGRRTWKRERPSNHPRQELGGALSLALEGRKEREKK